MSETTASFGELLRQHRLLAGLTQAGLAERAGLSVYGIQKLERGVTRPYRETARRLAKALQLTPDEQNRLASTVRPVRRHSSQGSGAATRMGPRNLPLPATSFIGREQELAEIRGLLEVTRLLTLTGVGGIGKTRIALELARRLAAEGTAVAIVDLAPLADPALVPQAIAVSVGVREQQGRRLLETLIDALRAGRLLLVLDNCEHLIQRCAELVEALLENCPALRILATSRESLRARGETAWRVPPLRAPHGGAALTIEGLGRHEASRLFMERACAALPALSLRDRDAGAVAEVCRQLDGIPLAIELAAARIKVLSVEQIAERLHDQLRLLVGAGRAVPLRQQTLRATLDWSYAVLPRPEQVLLGRLAVFAGGWSLEAAEAVVGTNEIAPEEVLDLLEGLVEKSLVVVEHPGDIGHSPRHVRYRLLEPIRQYAAERLAATGELEGQRRRHCDWFARFVERQVERLSGPEQVDAFVRLEAEHDNLRAALDWCEVEPGGWEAGAQLADELRWFWGLRGYVREGRERLDRLLALATERTAGHARALSAAGNLAQQVGEYDRAAALLEESVEIWRELGDQRGAAVALARFGQLEQSRGDYDRAWMLLEESRRLCPEVGTGSGLDAPLGVYLAQVAKNRGDPERAIPLFEECLRLARAGGELHAASSILRSLGELTQGRGDYERAADYLRESLLIIRELDDRACALTALDSLAVLAAAQGDSARAARLFAAAAASRAAQGRSLPSTEQDRLDQAAVDARARLGRATFDAAWSEGRAMTLEQAMEAALTSDQPAKRARSDPRETPTGSEAALLTCREREVADLIARGYTNRQIAADLVISERTVHAHVRNVLAKLDFGSRAQVAAWAAQEGWLKTQPR